LADLKISVVTPEATALETAAAFVAVPLFDGELGVAVGHSPMIGRLGYGELRVGQGADAKRYYVDGGFVQVADNTVTVLTNRAIDADQLDAATATSDLEAARARTANSPELLEIRDRETARARAQLRLAKRK
jgi:F-type H+-transporting ATPase subunit epsilon